MGFELFLLKQTRIHCYEVQTRIKFINQANLLRNFGRAHLFGRFRWTFFETKRSLVALFLLTLAHLVPSLMNPEIAGPA